jgi:hypothetical protein
VRDPAALPELALMGRELDRSKGSGETHDKAREAKLASSGLSKVRASRTSK